MEVRCNNGEFLFDIPALSNNFGEYTDEAKLIKREAEEVWKEIEQQSISTFVALPYSLKEFMGLKKDDFMIAYALMQQAKKTAVDTVRKETIKRVCQTLYDFCTREDNPWQEIEICKDEVLEYAKQNGIDLEVDE